MLRVLLWQPLASAASCAQVHLCRSFSYSKTLFSATSSGTDRPSGIQVKWFYATDVPVSRPDWYEYEKEKEAEKFIPFSTYDSRRLEKRYQALYHNKGEASKDPKNGLEPHIVEVNEDKLFQVDLNDFLLSPVYWEGACYEVRRGTWFSSSGYPLSYKMALLVEEGYQAKKHHLQENKEEAAQVSSKESKDIVARFNKGLEGIKNNVDINAEVDLSKEPDIAPLKDDKYVLFCDKKNAAIFPGSMNSKRQIGVIRNFGASSVALMSVEKIQRGYTDDLDKTILDNIPSNPLPALTDIFHNEVMQLFNPADGKGDNEQRARSLEATDQLEQLKDVLETDYDQDASGTSSNREIDHLVLCIHGIGQILGSRYESVNFTHSVNVLRSTMKSVYQAEEQYQKLAYPDSDEVSTENNRIQVLPISWRHKVDFHPEKNIAVFDEDGNHALPTLSQINVDGVKPLRNILGDVVLDILLYYEPRHIKQILEVVISELNHVYKLYKERNPNFNGKVHIMGHSLGSAISFDILSSQDDNNSELDLKKNLAFEVEDLFCVGSPLAMFKLISQKRIASRDSIKKDSEQGTACSVVSPKCKNLYNIFHPCDPVSYRMEPLISPKFAQFKPEVIAFASDGLNSKMKGLADLQEKIISKASSWLKRPQAQAENKGIDERAHNEDALGDILGNIVSSEPSKEEQKSRSSVSKRDLETLTSINRTGRVDYCLPVGVWDISLVSAVSAHVSYFEDKDTAGFMMREILSSNRNAVESKTVSMYKEGTE